MSGEKGMQYNKKSFTIIGGEGQGKKCFKADCANENKCCDLCYRVQGNYTYYHSTTDFTTVPPADGRGVV